MTQNTLINQEQYAKHWPLHALFRDYSQGIRLDDEAWFSEFNALIEAGSDVNARCEEGFAPFELLNPAGSPGVASWFYAQKVAERLVEHGYNPLLVDQNDNIPALYTFLGAEDGPVEEAFGFALIRGLLTREKTAPMRTKEGGNILHAMIRDEPGLLPWILDSDSAAPSFGVNIPAEWMDMPDQHGRRPLDLVWGTNGSWWQTLDIEDEDEIEIDVSFLLAATGAMTDAGADIFTPDARGFVLADAIWRGVKASSEAIDQLERSPFLSMIEHHAIGRDTAAPKSAKPRQTRL